MSPTPTRRAGRRLLAVPSWPIAAFLMYYGLRTFTRGRGPEALEQTLPMWLTWSWAGALVVGGVLVFWGILADRSRAESTGHAFHLFGIALWTAVNVALVDGSDVVTVVILAAVSALRMSELKRQRRAHREVNRILHGRRPA